jgi:FlaG/FlaF family flagellin (archaellin)
MNMDFKKNEDAVSHVIDTILMVAVVVILAVVISGIIQ